MKSLAPFLFLLLANPLFADGYDFSPLQGLRNAHGEVWFEISGYDIFTESFKGDINQLKTLASFKKKYKIKDIQAEYSDPQLVAPHKIIEAKKPMRNNPGVKFDLVYYLLQQPEKEITVIYFQTLAQRDVFLEQEFVKAFIADSLSGYISGDWKEDVISFAGRTVELGNACGWRSPHNFSCKGGQISWSEFSSSESAGLYLDARIAANDGGSLSVLSNDYIEVLFEDIPTIAYRVAYKQDGSYYPLIVYYVEQEIRGHYLSCILSNYGYNRNDYELSSLLQKFMSIPDVPDWAYNPLDVPQFEALSEKETEQLKRQKVHGEIRSGLTTPLGNLRNVFEMAPMLDFFFIFPVKTQMSIDFGMAFAFPIKPAPFDFGYQTTKAQSVIQGSLRYSYHHALGKNRVWSPYFGAGFSFLGTDLLKGVRDDGTEEYYSVDALDLYGGFNLRYRFIGCFVEYHHSTYSQSSKVINNFGNNSLNFGLLIHF
ncbi:MAG: hypothetical protein LBI65_02405 [Candidatus Symbiothrix sp.]|jgi:hypothetical protein|nr:hypothetical protein [Candidatus Symbiothrix sp.]